MAGGIALTPKQVELRTRKLLKKYPSGLRFPKYRLHKPSGRAVIQYRPIFGANPRYLAGAYGSEESLADYDRQLARIVKHMAKAAPAKVLKFDTIQTVEHFVAAFMQWAAKHHGDGREFSHFKRAVRPLRRRFGERMIKTIGPVRLKLVRKDMVRNGWCRKHVNAQFNRLRAVFAWGVENELISPRQLAAIQTVKGLRKGKTKAPDHPEVPPVLWSEAEQLLPNVSPVVAAMIEVQYLTGMRSSELTAMCIEEIEFRADVWIYRPVQHKTAYAGKPKIICIGPRAQSLLVPYLQVPVEQCIFSPRIAMREHYEARRTAAKSKRYGKRKKSRFNPYRYRERYFTDSYYQALAHGFDLMDKGRDPKNPVNRWHPHQLRHARATLTREQYDLEGSQAQLGNTIQATEIYARKSLPLAIKVALETG